MGCISAILCFCPRVDKWRLKAPIPKACILKSQSQFPAENYVVYVLTYKQQQYITHKKCKFLNINLQIVMHTSKVYLYKQRHIFLGLCHITNSNVHWNIP